MEKTNINNNKKSSENNIRFLFAAPLNERIFDGFYDETARDRIDIIPVYRKMQTRLGTNLQRLFLSPKINRFVHMPLRNRFHSIEDYSYKDEIDYCMIVPTMSLLRWELYEISRFKEKHSNVKLVLLILDSLHASSKHIPYIKNKIFSDVWDLVVTYDKYDAAEYGFLWLGYTYYPQCQKLPYIEGQSDAFYLGFNKGKRTELIGEVYLLLKSNGVDCDFRIVADKNEEGEIVPGLSITKERYKYSEVAAMANNTNCIIEVLMDGQKSQSYRYFEALTYNKKLLTNNKNVYTLPYYDERYMKCFEKVEDIDPNWVKKRESIDYGYKGEFSQIRLLDFLETHINQ